MNTQTINQFTGTKTIDFPTYTSVYFTIYDRNNIDITDTNIISVTTNASGFSITLNSSNILSTSFPLKLVWFDYLDITEAGTLKPFAQTPGTPTNNDLFAIGKRKATAKNVTLSELSDFITDNGTAYVKKANNLSDVQKEEARNNLEIYSKDFIDFVPNNYVSNRNDFSHSFVTDLGQYSILAEAIGFDTSSLSVDVIGCKAQIDTHYNSSMCTVRVTVKEVSCFNYYSYSEYKYICTTQELFNGVNITVPNPMIIPCTVIDENLSLTAFPFASTWKHIEMGNEGAEIIIDGTHNFDSYLELPQLVITSDQPFKYRGGTFSANTVYIVHPDSKLFQRSQAVYLPYRTFDFIYETTFVPNDSQLN